MPLVVWSDVLDPTAFRAGRLLARAVADEVCAGMRTLDLGTGSGVGALFAARQGAPVVAVDLNPAAVRCARANAVLHGFEDLIEVREGDLFVPVAGETFDRVLFNPPFYRGTPRSAFDAAFRSEDVLERFAAGLSGVLAPDGAALLVLSSLGACDDLRAALVSGGFGLEELRSARFPGETITIVRVARRS